MLPSCGFRVFVVYVTGLGSLYIYHLLLVQSTFCGPLLLKLFILQVDVIRSALFWRFSLAAAAALLSRLISRNCVRCLRL